MTCRDCPWYERCSERRGVCTEFMNYIDRISEAKHGIKEANSLYKDRAVQSPGANNTADASL